MDWTEEMNAKTTPPDSPELDRAIAALTGVAVGDALGMPSQTLPRDEIRTRYGTITDFVAPFAGHPVSHGLEAANVTDDTEQTMLMAEALIAGHGRIDEAAWAEALIGWEADVRARGLRDLLGPSSKRALEALIGGAAPDETGRKGTTNGAAMRITPVGIATPPGNLPAFTASVARACRVTHNTREAIASAAAVAMVVSLGVAGESFDASLPRALEAARAGTGLGAPEGVADMAERIERALAIALTGTEADIAREVGTSVASHESVPAAFALVRIARGDPWQAAVLAANIGDDTDTIGAIAAAMAGATGGSAAFPADKTARVIAVNGLRLRPLAAGLLALRHQNAGQQHTGGGQA